RNLALKQKPIVGSLHASDRSGSGLTDRVVPQTYDSVNCIYTDTVDRKPWAVVKFSQPVRLQEIVVHNIADQQYWKWLNKFTLRTYDENEQLVLDYNHSGGEAERFSIRHTTTSSVVSAVRVVLPPGGVLMACELELYGDCPPKTHGLDCTNSCSEACYDGQCDIEGNCLSCSPGNYSSDCLMACSSACINSTYDKNSGECFEGCMPGYYTARCDKGKTINCNKGKTINCGKGKTINCDKRKIINCDKGKIINCDKGKIINCDKGKIINCNKGTTINCNKGKTINCDKGKTINCDKGKTINCDKGKTINCDKGKIINCNKACSSACVNNTCDGTSGLCSEGCLPGYEGANCEKECDPGYYGSECGHNCHEVCSTNCSNVNGHCNACPQIHYGPMCENVCSENCINENCRHTDGGCVEGCNIGYYGYNCSQECSKGCIGALCLWDGSCLDGCVRGFFSVNCSIECSKNCGGSGKCNSTLDYCLEGCKPRFYGLDCSKECDKLCSGDGSCDITNGSCTKMKVGCDSTDDCPKDVHVACGDHCGGDKTCMTSTGRCRHGCAVGYGGLNCSLECQNCLGKLCEQTTMMCTKGCANGFGGSDCSLKSLKSKMPDEKEDKSAWLFIAIAAVLFVSLLWLAILLALRKKTERVLVTFE
ncbi:hypothetical protein Btru_013638, partial [Bulinus truncatus]